MKISLIIPVYNEEKNVSLLVEKIEETMKKSYENNSYEIIFVDDGSKDQTLYKIKESQKKNKNIKAIVFRRNFGQTAAIDAGVQHASGNIIVTLDGDLQNDPRDILRLIEKLHQGYDVVCGWRYRRKDNLGKVLASRVADKIRKVLINDKIHDAGCSLKAYRADVIKSIALYGEMHRYIPVILAMKGYRVAEVKVKHHRRKYGKTKYGINRLFKGALDLLYVVFWGNYSARPLHIFGYLSVLQFLLAFILLLYNFMRYGPSFSIGPLLLLAAFLIISGLLSFILGVLSEIMIRTYYSTSKEKCYSIRKII